ncbi:MULTISPECIES: helix-turn-helix domain-containing protein [unclassified Streptomyces]|uniref:helix-turn-helix domain-containing protein n=1 Tax=unclassified Streptomyces TaxID=2593676 RepID=UPI002DD949A7|nr:helix-turn-helix transcriptional regulator [Streptomyces sp. NBC_01237]WRZ73815.1 helix-turn-helix domain-containing protein [Streptomyces sp. NBC_01237]
MEHRDDDAAVQQARDFGQWLHDQLVRRGYEMSARGGGRTRFADVSGIGRATISRILTGQGATDTRVLAQLAAALDVPLAEILVRAGILSADELRAVQTPGARRHITPDEAADELGIDDAQARRLFISMTETLRHQANTNGDAVAD